MMSKPVNMEVDEADAGGTNQKPIVVSRTGMTLLSPPNIVLALSSANQQRVIQAIPTTVTSGAGGGKSQRLQIVRLVAPAQQQQLLKNPGAPVRVVTAGATGTKIQIAPVQNMSSTNPQPPRFSKSQRLILPANSKLTSAPQIVTIPVSSNGPRLQTVLSSGATVFTPSSATSQVLAFLSPHKSESGSTVSQPVRVVTHTLPSSHSSSSRAYLEMPSTDTKPEASPIKKEPVNDANQRKPCNCTKSHCLKLYCDCFAKGEFCSNCNCVGCANVLSKEEQRQKAIKQCLMRNPHAFHPKIGKGESAQVRRHQKGCNCKRSGCLKNYCECFEAKIMCGTMCKCVGCKNCEENSSSVSLMRLADAAMVRTMQHNTASGTTSYPQNELSSSTSSNKSMESMKAHLTEAVIEGVLDCVLAQCREAEVAKCKTDTTQKLILEEFGRCVTRVIQSSTADSTADT